jgi:uncharacterized protein
MFVDLSDRGARDLDALGALNNAHKVETSELDGAQLAHMLDGAFLALTTADSGALLIAFDQDAAYASPNFLWFKARNDRFVYVDRIIVSVAQRGRGIARQLYEQLFDVARIRGHAVVMCEVNSDPPNPGSDAFHAALGFNLVGKARLANGKSVRYLACSISTTRR